jgi:hypothetical protein
MPSYFSSVALKEQLFSACSLLAFRANHLNRFMLLPIYLSAVVAMMW